MASWKTRQTEGRIWILPLASQVFPLTPLESGLTGPTSPRGEKQVEGLVKPRPYSSLRSRVTWGPRVLILRTCRWLVVSKRDEEADLSQQKGQQTTAATLLRCESGVLPVTSALSLLRSEGGLPGRQHLVLCQRIACDHGDG